VVRPAAEVWTLDAAVVWALQNNPELAALRQQHGIAAAAVVIARTYPYNPTLETKVQAASGPQQAGVTNPVDSQYALLFQLELCGQRFHRRDAAAAALSRADWEIAFQEQALAIRVARAFHTALYRREKLALVEETVRLNQQVADQVRKLAEQGKLRGADLLLARTEVEDTRAQLIPARSALINAESELRRGLGVLAEPLTLHGKLQASVVTFDGPTLTQAALEQRADLHARTDAITEAEARLRLTAADRFGNPTVGPAYQFDQSRVHFIGAQMTFPLPLFNRHQGEIQQREAEQGRAVLELQQAQVQVRQEVQTALLHLDQVRDGVATYEKEILPNLRAAVEGVEKLFRQGDPGADVLRVIDLRRKLLRARDGYLDVLWQATQSQADLAAAVGDPALAVAPFVPVPAPCLGPDPQKGHP
jgi:cobalt-zinc-cadmium efflux system outer membrane protein